MNSGASRDFTAPRVLIVGSLWGGRGFLYYGYNGQGLFLFNNVNASASVSGETHTITNNYMGGGIRYTVFFMR